MSKSVIQVQSFKGEDGTAQPHRSTIAVAVSVALLLGLETNPTVGAVKPAPAWRAPAVDAGPSRGGPDYRSKTTPQLAVQAAADQLQVTPVDEAGVDGVPAFDLAETLMGGRGSVSNAQFTGAPSATRCRRPVILSVKRPAILSSAAAPAATPGTMRTWPMDDPAGRFLD